MHSKMHLYVMKGNKTNQTLMA